MNLGFENRQSSISEEERKREVLKEFPDVVADQFFNKFITINAKPIEAGDLESIGNNLEKEIKNLIDTAKEEQGQEYAHALAGCIEHCLKISRPILANPRDQEVKEKAEIYISKILTSK